MGIRGLLSILVPGLVALGLVFLALLSAHRERIAVIEHTRLREVQVLEAIGLTASVYLAQNDAAGLDNLVEEATANGRAGNLVEISVVEDDTRVLAHSDPRRFNTLQPDDFTRLAILAAGPTWTLTGDELRVAVPARSGLRWGTVTARYSITPVLAAVDAARTRALVQAIGLAAIAWLVLAVSLTRTVVMPLRKLQVVARRMGGGESGARVPALWPSEFTELASTFNQMAEALHTERANLERTVEERTVELKAANTRLERLAVLDGLTGLFNHRHFQESLAQEVARCRRSNAPMALLMCDVDHFKRLNDTLGHPAGDEVLREIAAVLVSALRVTDLCARYGGEEFAMILPDTNAADAGFVAERVRRSVETTFTGTPARRSVTISVGSAAWPADGATPEALLSAADRALYEAKHGGRNCVVPARTGKPDVTA